RSARLGKPENMLPATHSRGCLRGRDRHQNDRVLGRLGSRAAVRRPTIRSAGTVASPAGRTTPRTTVPTAIDLDAHCGPVSLRCPGPDLAIALETPGAQAEHPIGQHAAQHSREVAASPLFVGQHQLTCRTAVAGHGESGNAARQRARHRQWAGELAQAPVAACRADRATGGTADREDQIEQAHAPRIGPLHRIDETSHRIPDASGPVVGVSAREWRRMCGQPGKKGDSMPSCVFRWESHGSPVDDTVHRPFSSAASTRPLGRAVIPLTGGWRFAALYTAEVKPSTDTWITGWEEESVATTSSCWVI